MSATDNPLTSPLQPTCLIEASAGTGKTYTIAGLYLRLLLGKGMSEDYIPEQGLSVDQILVVTFTKAATEELKDRIRQNIVRALEVFQGTAEEKDPFFTWLSGIYPAKEPYTTRLHRALVNFDQCAIHTIHGFCQKILHENTFRASTPFSLELTTDQGEMIMECVRDFWRRRMYPASELFVRYLLDKKLGPKHIKAHIARGFNHLSLTVLPDDPLPDTTDLEKQVEDLFQELRKSWECHRNRVSSIMTGYEGLNRNRYKKATMEKRLVLMERLLECGPTVCLFKGFETFTLTTLENGGVKKNFEVPECDFFTACDRFHRATETLSRAYEHKVPRLLAQVFREVQLDLSRTKKETNTIGYDDLIREVHRALTSDHGQSLISAVRHRFRGALIDEFQDTDPLQYEIFRILFNTQDHVLVMVGDPKQAIYSFRGADVFAYLRAARATPVKESLSVNYRSHARLLKAVNHIFSNRKDPFVLPEIIYEQIDPKPSPAEGYDSDSHAALTILHLVPSEDSTGSNFKEARDLGARAARNEIVRLLKQGSCVAGDMAVLVRTNQEAAVMHRLLAQVNVPAVVYSSGSVLATDQARDMIHILQAAADPLSAVKIRTALATDTLGMEPERLDLHIPDQSELERAMERFHGYHTLWARSGFIRMFRKLLVQEGVLERVLGRPGGERVMTNLLHIMELLHRQDRTGNTSMNGMVAWMIQRLEDSDTADEEHQLRLESDKDGLTILTIHKSKGLQFPVVFCPFLVNGSKVKRDTPIFLHQNQDLIMDTGSEDFVLKCFQADREYLAENIRLLYVALTRAKDRCCLCWGPVGKYDTSPFGYLLAPSLDVSKGLEDLSVELSSWTGTRSLQILSELAEKSGGTIEVLPPPGSVSPCRGQTSQPSEELACRTFAGTITSVRRVSSFTALTAGHHHSQGMDLDQELSVRTPERDSLSQTKSILTFPKGAKAGIFFHTLLERWDFSNPDYEELSCLTRELLAAYGFDLQWEDVVSQAVFDMAHVPLTENGTVQLNRVTQDRRLSEMEFFHPLKRLSSATLGELFSPTGQSTWTASFSERLGALRFEPHQGFMRGFIDLVFEQDKRFYLVDWKSNHLGDTPEEYHRDNLLPVMEREFYLLQYHLYSLALHKYLARRVMEYDYNIHFGGVFYVFLRGVDKGLGPEYGIFYDRPCMEFIDSLDNGLIGQQT